MSKPYEALFAIGDRVVVEDRSVLEKFAREWKYHNPLMPSQIDSAGMHSTVKDVGFYHGGDPIYQLENVEGTWHEGCLKASTHAA